MQMSISCCFVQDLCFIETIRMNRKSPNNMLKQGIIFKGFIIMKIPSVFKKHANAQTAKNVAVKTIVYGSALTLLVISSGCARDPVKVFKDGVQSLVDLPGNALVGSKKVTCESLRNHDFLTDYGYDECMKSKQQPTNGQKVYTP